MEKTTAEHVTDICDPDDDVRAFARQISSRLGEKWAMTVLGSLLDGPHRFTAVMNAVPGISHRVLTVTLRSLESDGMVSRTVYPETPPRVEYAITPLGESFFVRALSLIEWAQDHREEVEANRAGFAG